MFVGALACGARFVWQHIGLVWCHRVEGSKLANDVSHLAWKHPRSEHEDDSCSFLSCVLRLFVFCRHGVRARIRPIRLRSMFDHSSMSDGPKHAERCFDDRVLSDCACKLSEARGVSARFILLCCTFP